MGFVVVVVAGKGGLDRFMKRFLWEIDAGLRIESGCVLSTSHHGLAESINVSMWDIIYKSSIPRTDVTAATDHIRNKTWIPDESCLLATPDRLL